VTIGERQNATVNFTLPYAEPTDASHVAHR
jgi:hypothetical protein